MNAEQISWFRAGSALNKLAKPCFLEAELVEELEPELEYAS